MSLSDYIKYLRAVKGGLTPWEIADGSGVPAREIHLIEAKHRRVGDNDAILQQLSTYFGVPVEELTRRRDAYRKRLTFFLEENERQSSPVRLMLEDGEEVEGMVGWFGREAVALYAAPSDPDPSYVVQRAWIANWKPASAPEWEVAADQGE